MQFLKPVSALCTGILLCCSCNSNHSTGKSTPAAIRDTAATPEDNTASTAETEHEKVFPRPADMPANIVIKSIATGDLNKDGLADSVIVTVDTAAGEWPVTMKIFFATANGYQLAASSDKALAPLRPGGNEYGNDFGDATIDAGVITVYEQLLRGHNDYKYRYQDGHFELIGYTSGYAEAGVIHSTDYNLVTGSLHYEEVNQETDEVLKKHDVRFKIQRPKLDNFEAESVEIKTGDIDFYL